MAVGAALLATTVTSVGFTMVAEAQGGTTTTDVNFVSLATPYKLLTNKAFAANTSESVVVIGGSTKVPSNVTTVQLSVEAGGSTAGTMNFNPAGNVSGGSGQYLSWGAGGSETETIEENVGLADELTFALSGGAAKVTATITGYSSQVTDGDVSGLDGTSGQVLTNNGSGAAWANPSVGAGDITPTGGSTGQVLTNNGSGAAWQGPRGGPGYAQVSSNSWTLSSYAYTTVASVTLPAGSFMLNFTADAFNAGSASDYAYCYMFAPGNGDPVAYSYTSLAPEADNDLVGQALVTTTGGTYTEQCFNGQFNGNTIIGENANPTLSAIEVSSANGTVFDDEAERSALSAPPGVAGHPVPER
jgi:hypothetical protein